ncbi:hypothetical protein K505DRAFT_340206 [Melanomma pulvis-pyrius CBS 109.77]|uniref:Uncharacterized protein n=1 Tax=Melanomma pulvis-pyrius CBS 109.77 TaxID=1314802 RepID=A0A6A6X2V9_9PLEO|nr:hypothetical protein K505DRAFT_340206 [Melanomma pulvis-pyrius CBS 109.77]
MQCPPYVVGGVRHNWSVGCHRLGTVRRDERLVGCLGCFEVRDVTSAASASAGAGAGAGAGSSAVSSSRFGADGDRRHVVVASPIQFMPSVRLSYAAHGAADRKFPSTTMDTSSANPPIKKGESGEDPILWKHKSGSRVKTTPTWSDP